MPQTFPKWTNYLALMGALGGPLFAGAAIGGVWYFGSPKYTDIGYQPVQPVPYSHRLHVKELGMDCRYCHATVETAASATIPPTDTCLNCHSLVARDAESLAPIRASKENNQPVEWIRIHNLPDYAYFNHAVHVRAGVGCISCHGHIDEMEVVYQAEPLSMGWCLECHRNPEPHLRPVEEVTNMKWIRPENHAEMAAEWVVDRQLAPPEDCSGCHR